jgi:ABC-type amino acid transport system permease subunit
MALVMGVVLGSVVAVRVAPARPAAPRPPQPGAGLCQRRMQIYTTVIRGTPMMVQLLIMSMVIFANSRNFTMVGALAGHQLRRVRRGDHPRRPDVR